MFEAISGISKWVIPLMLFGIPLYGAFRGVKVYESFTDGAKGSFETAIRLIPFLVGMLVAVAIFRESGAMDLLIKPLGGLLGRLGIPREVVPLGLMRPISGSGALAMLSDLLKAQGPDSMSGRMASTLVGSTETTLYIIAVYFGSVGIKRVRHSLAVGLLADAIGLVVSVIICGMAFR